MTSSPFREMSLPSRWSRANPSRGRWPHRCKQRLELKVSSMLLFCQRLPRVWKVAPASRHACWEAILDAVLQSQFQRGWIRLFTEPEEMPQFPAEPAPEIPGSGANVGKVPLGP